MRRISLRTILIYGFAGLSGTLLFYTSQNVQKAEDELRVVKREALKEEEAIRVLEAEWAYLNTPERLEKLAVEHLSLAAPAAGQLMPGDLALPESEGAIYEEISMPSVPSPEAAKMFVTPRKKPLRKQKPQKSFDKLLGEL